VHKGLDEKKPSLPKFGLSFNERTESAGRQTRPTGDSHQKNRHQSPNGLKKITWFSHLGATFKGSHRLSH
jgi:hypothetical protein